MPVEPWPTKQGTKPGLTHLVTSPSAFLTSLTKRAGGDGGKVSQLSLFTLLGSLSGDKTLRHISGFTSGRLGRPGLGSSS